MQKAVAASVSSLNFVPLSLSLSLVTVHFKVTCLADEWWCLVSSSTCRAISHLTVTSIWTLGTQHSFITVLLAHSDDDDDTRRLLSGHVALLVLTRSLLCTLQSSTDPLHFKSEPYHLAGSMSSERKRA